MLEATRTIRKGQITAEVLTSIPAGRMMKRGRPHFALVVLRPHDGLPEEMGLAYYEVDRLGQVDQSSVRLIRFGQGSARRLAEFFKQSAELVERWAPVSSLEVWR